MTSCSCVFDKDVFSIIQEYAKKDLLILFQEQCAYGSAEDAQWLCELGLTLEDVKSDDNYAFQMSCLNQNLVLSKWLFGLGLTLEDIQIQINFNDVCACGDFEMAQWGFWTRYHSQRRKEER